MSGQRHEDSLSLPEWPLGGSHVALTSQEALAGMHLARDRMRR
jgi:hypothetical protein